MDTMFLERHCMQLHWNQMQWGQACYSQCHSFELQIHSHQTFECTFGKRTVRIKLKLLVICWNITIPIFSFCPCIPWTHLLSPFLYLGLVRGIKAAETWNTWYYCWRQSRSKGAYLPNGGLIPKYKGDCIVKDVHALFKLHSKLRLVLIC